MKNNPRTSALTMARVVKSGTMNHWIAQSCSFTFKPLKGGWYRCNQTGDRTKNPKTYMSQHSGVMLDGSKMSYLSSSKVQNTDPQRHYVSVEVSDRAQYMICPKCGTQNPIRDGKCIECKTLLDVILLKSADSWLAYNCREYLTICPHCNNKMSSEKKSDILTCTRCKEKFMTYYNPSLY